MAAVKKFGYQPNMNARGLASRTSHMISVVVPNLTHVFADIYFGEIVSGIYEKASQSNYKVLLDIANERFIEKKEYLNILASRRADGMLFVGSSVEDSFQLEFEETPYPFLLVNHYYPDSSLNYSAINYQESARLAARHLVDLGHKTIGAIISTNTYTGLEIKNVFVRECLKMGLDERDIIWTDGGKAWNQEGGYHAAEEMLKQKPRMTAIMAGNDRMALGALHYLQTHGVRIPEDISLVGMDDIPAAEFCTPGLTTIRHNLYQLGELACERLLALFRKDITDCHDVMPAELVIRGSTGPAKTKV